MQQPVAQAQYFPIIKESNSLVSEMHSNLALQKNPPLCSTTFW